MISLRYLFRNASHGLGISLRVWSWAYVAWFWCLYRGNPATSYDSFVPENLATTKPMDYLDYVTLRGDVSWDVHPNLCSRLLCGPTAEWIRKPREHSWRRSVEFRPHDTSICWTCRDNVKTSFYCKDCKKDWCRSCHGKYLERVEYTTVLNVGRTEQVYSWQRMLHLSSDIGSAGTMNPDLVWLEAFLSKIAAREIAWQLQQDRVSNKEHWE